MENVPVNIVGSSTFGIYPKISLEKTYNMFISDNWMINYAGYRRLLSNIEGQEGRGLFHSIRGDFLLVVIDENVYRLNSSFGSQKIGRLRTRRGEVIMDENLTSQICIVDGNNAWIYNYQTNSFTQQALNVGFDLVPGYVTYHNSFFLIAPSPNDANNTNNWYAFQRQTDDTIELVVNSVFPLQTKPDICLAVKRLPGRSNHVLVIGSSVCEVFVNVGGLQNYRRNSSFNIDSGCVSRSTIAANEEFLCFLAQNENNSPSILYTNGSEINYISTDGIDNLLQTIVRPDKSTAFFYRQDGHLFYHLTFFDPEDNLSLIYDFKTGKFYHITDDDYNFHPARQIAYFNKRNIFVGLEKGVLYEMSTSIDSAIEDLEYGSRGREIPRIRICGTTRSPSGEPFRANKFQFTMEQGVTEFSELDAQSSPTVGDMITELTQDIMITEDDQVMVTESGGAEINVRQRPAVDLSFSKNGNSSFSSSVRRYLNPQGFHQNEIHWRQLCRANEITLQLRFWGLNRFVVNNGYLRLSR